MTTISQDLINGIEILVIENDHISVSIAPALGGKVLSVFNKKLLKEFIWINKQLPLKTNMPGADYDSNFIFNCVHFSSSCFVCGFYVFVSQRAI